ncbi:porin family protein [Reichenbachiella versicolor]|uniref:porin family protein n=1 Tax=Reichenbachiella versicolor TaxID=1821036 RepID=UPI000D6E90E7|nr:porin family protein [Reichenbachiella versicolor]
MKRALFLIIFLVSAVQISYGQSKTYIGVNAGASFGSANIFSSFDVIQIDERFTPGYQFGLTMMNFMEEHIGVQFGLSYIQKGWSQKFSDEVGIANHVTQLDYIELPMLVHVYSGKERLHFFANAGCFVGYMIKSKIDADPDGLVEFREFRTESTRILPYQLVYQTTNDLGDPATASDDFIAFDEDRDRKIDYGLKGGVGAYYDFDFGTLMLEINGGYSISDVFDSGDFSTGVPNVSKKINAGIVVGYLFSFGSIRKKTEE